MREIPTTKGYVAIVDDEDYELVTKNGRKWQTLINRRRDGSVQNTYARSHVPNTGRGGPSELMHRLILGVTDEKIEIDHRNHNGLDNRRANIRLSTKSGNQRNQRLRIDNASGFQGVAELRGRRTVNRWQAYIVVNRKMHYVGVFPTPKAAAEARANALSRGIK